MDKASLEKALKETNERFSELAQTKAGLDDEIVKLNTEMVKLQGEARVYERLLKEKEGQSDAQDNERPAEPDK